MLLVDRFLAAARSAQLLLRRRSPRRKLGGPNVDAEWVCDLTLRFIHKFCEGFLKQALSFGFVLLSVKLGKNLLEIGQCGDVKRG